MDTKTTRTTETSLSTPGKAVVTRRPAAKVRTNSSRVSTNRWQRTWRAGIRCRVIESHGLGLSIPGHVFRGLREAGPRKVEVSSFAGTSCFRSRLQSAGSIAVPAGGQIEYQATKSRAPGTGCRWLSRRRSSGSSRGLAVLELGLRSSGYESALLCENAPSARTVLGVRFAGTGHIADDVLTLEALPEADVVTAGFPCTDLSQAGRLAGIDGPQSGLVARVFELLRRGPEPRWLVLENVPFLLQLARGAGMRYLVEQNRTPRVPMGIPRGRYARVRTAAATPPGADRRFARRGPKCRAARGRCRAASGTRCLEARRVLLDRGQPRPRLDTRGSSSSQGESGLGIPSAPAIWNRDAGEFFTPDIRDAERLQGFPVDWTKPGGTPGARWKLVGNAVSVPVARWLGGRLACPAAECPRTEHQLTNQDRWPRAGRGACGKRFAAEVSEWPVANTAPPLNEFLQFEHHPLSWRAASGFLREDRASRLRFEPGFLELTCCIRRTLNASEG